MTPIEFVQLNHPKAYAEELQFKKANSKVIFAIFDRRDETKKEIGRGPTVLDAWKDAKRNLDRNYSAVKQNETGDKPSYKDLRRMFPGVPIRPKVKPSK